MAFSGICEFEQNVMGHISFLNSIFTFGKFSLYILTLDKSYFHHPLIFLYFMFKLPLIVQQILLKQKSQKQNSKFSHIFRKNTYNFRLCNSLFSDISGDFLFVSIACHLRYIFLMLVHLFLRYQTKQLSSFSFKRVSCLLSPIYPPC